MVEKYQVLASGIDSLDVSIDVKWNDELFFEYLASKKFGAQETNQDQVIKLPESDQIALLKPYGRKGHEWIIENEWFSLSIGNWLEPKSRPSIMLSIRSIALWCYGVRDTIELISSLIINSNGEILSIKPSRIDLCVDIVLPESIWNTDLLSYRVTRASYAAPHLFNTDRQGISIGKGAICARLYDKPLEIRQKSKKFWMYNIWEIEKELSDDIKIIRIEGQIRREVIKELGLNHLDETLDHIDKIWAYVTQDWLKFQRCPGKHHTMRKTFRWWKIVQNSFLGVQDPSPLIRCKSISQNKKQLYAQTHGALASILALTHELCDLSFGSSAILQDMVEELKSCFKEYGKSDFELEIEVLEKRAKKHKAKSKALQVHKERTKKGLPSNLHPEIDLDKKKRC